MGPHNGTFAGIAYRYIFAYLFFIQYYSPLITPVQVFTPCHLQFLSANLKYERYKNDYAFTYLEIRRLNSTDFAEIKYTRLKNAMR